MEKYAMNKVYQLKQDLENYANFLEQWDNLENTFHNKYWNWKDVNLDTYQPIKVKLYTSDTGKKNFKTDISRITGGLFIFSEKAIQVLKEILEQTGQVIPIETESKRKKFYGFYPNKNTYNDSIINLEKSVWREAEKGKIINRLVLNNSYPKDDYLFTLFDEPMDAFVTEKFKDLVEKNDLKGFDFSKEILISD